MNMALSIALAVLALPLYLITISAIEGTRLRTTALWMLFVFAWATYAIAFHVSLYQSAIGAMAEEQKKETKSQKFTESLPKKTAYVTGIALKAWDEKNSAAIADIAYKKENGELGVYQGWASIAFGDGGSSEMSYNESESSDKKTIYGVSVSLAKNERVNIDGLESRGKSKDASPSSPAEETFLLCFVIVLAGGISVLASIPFIRALRARRRGAAARTQSAGEQGLEVATRRIREAQARVAQTREAAENAMKAKELEEEPRRGARTIRA